MALRFGSVLVLLVLLLLVMVNSYRLPDLGQSLEYISSENVLSLPRSLVRRLSASTSTRSPDLMVKLPIVNPVPDPLTQRPVLTPVPDPLTQKPILTPVPDLLTQPPALTSVPSLATHLPTLTPILDPLSQLPPLTLVPDALTRPARTVATTRFTTSANRLPAQWYQINDTTVGLDEQTISRRNVVKQAVTAQSSSAPNVSVQSSWGATKIKEKRKQSIHYK
ncbi:hypothetical protein J6590_010976 [Homalodisca vitripennis]|nr:hypothetical protein J6590_010976 [Homalodisca vitripennis]